MANKLFSSRTFNSAFRFATYSKVHHRNYASEMSFTFASPSEVFYEKANVKQVDVPSYSGSFGILADHVPTLAVLKPGVVTVFENDGASKKFFVSSGSVTINDDSSVQVLAQEAVPLDRIDTQACREGLTKAQQALSSATTEVSKAEAQIAIEVHEELVKATS
ncbi:ATP synthase subunit delta, mitochondrial [Trichonephila clavata]|uniref:ATP synthase F(1) complex subunit delta, mitochondrial n=1 Tax=Trichonephila clavata TaxID=2740835 RepID=A0A8X6HHI7_TRICU|nr:ATP synthase subunit delta, mitochondrial [Trichonephila clavata]